ncbi:MAG: ribonuclease E/G, partial [Gammaproteobacteria bacterium]|nr:ribonuclease E/G [Gammaproteobacteria bacterium]
MKENTGALHVQLPVDVATFLLNEKRVDIHTLETRLKVNVVLIPNVHLETPHYTITRLRHDELNLREAAEPSYKLVALPEPESIYQTAQEAAPARQVAAVKSIAPPPQPVPAVRPAIAAAPQPQSGLFGRIFGWFKKQGEEAPAAKAAPEPVPALTRGERPSERRDRDRKPGQRRGRAEARGGEARPNEPRQAAPRESREARGSEQPKQPRPPRQPKPRPEAEIAPQVTEPVEALREPVSEEKRESRSRRGRGNRRPREARPETEAGTGEGTMQAGIDVTAAPAGFHAIIEIAGAPKAARAPAAPRQQAFELEATAVTASPAVVLADLATPTANLQQVETAAAAAAAAETQEAGRPRRRRRPVVKAEAEPVSLMQVETTSAPVAPTAGEATAPAAPHPSRRRARPQVSEVQEPLVQVETQAK